jgi:caprin-1
LEKKLRNLEKRKGKLDAYREKLRKGEKLDKDQKEAADKYDSVIASIEFARDLQKTYQSMSDEADKLAEKASKKQAKKDKMEKQERSMEMLSQVLKLQTLLNTLGTDEVRTELLSGKYGLTLTQENLTQLDEFYQTISPAVENSDSSFSDQLSTATENLFSYIDRLDKPVVGTTHRDLHALVDKLLGADFFTKCSASVMAAAAAVETSGDNEKVTAGGATEVEESSESTSGKNTTLSAAGTQSDVKLQLEPHDEGTNSSLESGVLVPGGMESESATYETISVASSSNNADISSSPSSSCNALQAPASTSLDAAGGSSTVAGMTWYNQSSQKSCSVQPAPATMTQRPVQDIVSSMQGSYNFLQESEIDVDQSFERVSFMSQQQQPVVAPVDHTYTFVNQQMLHNNLVNPSNCSSSSNGTTTSGFVHPHQMPLQEPGFVVIGHDTTAPDMSSSYASYSASQQPGYLNAPTNDSGSSSKKPEMAVSGRGSGDGPESLIHPQHQTAVPVLPQPHSNVYKRNGPPSNAYEPTHPRSNVYHQSSRPTGSQMAPKTR